MTRHMLFSIQPSNILINRIILFQHIISLYLQIFVSILHHIVVESLSCHMSRLMRVYTASLSAVDDISDFSPLMP